MSIGQIKCGVKAGDIITFGAYPHNADGKDMTAIQWRLLENTGKELILLSDKAIDNVKYHRDLADVLQWRDSDIRKWLNGECEFAGHGFIDIAFDAEQKRAISVTMNVDNGYYDPYKNNAYSEAGCAVTKDRVYLLSVGEVYRYFGNKQNQVYGHYEYYTTDKAALAEGTDFAKAKSKNRKVKLAHEGDGISFGYHNQYSCWWLRNSGKYSPACAPCVRPDYEVLSGGSYLTGSCCGVRPALRLSI